MQILDRITRIFKAGFADKSVNDKSYFESEDDELKRIIDELNSNKKSDKSDNQQNSSYESTSNSELENALNVLGLNSYANNDAIKSTYKKKMKEFHPDKVAHLSDDIRLRAEKRSKEINEAYTKIRKIRGF